MDVISLAVGAAAGGVLGYLPARLRKPAAPSARLDAEPEPAPPPEQVVVVVERAAEPERSVQPEPAPPVTTPEALELLKERDRRLTADAKLRLVRD